MSTAAARPLGTSPLVAPAFRWPLVLAGFSLMVLALMPPGNVSSDGGSMIAVTDSLATGHLFTVPCLDGIPGRGGACYSTYYPLQSILAAPLAFVGRGLASLVGTNKVYVGDFLAHVVPALSGAGTATFTVYFAGLWGASRRRALLAGLTVVFATELAIYFRTFFAESLCTLLVCAITFGLLRRDRWRWLAPIGTILLILAKPQLVLVAPLVAGVVWWTRRRAGDDDSWVVRAVFVATVIGTLLYAGYNALRFGDFSNFGGETRTLHSHNAGPTEVVKAFGLLMISPGRGFLVYSPITILGLWAVIKHRNRTLPRIALAIAVATLAVYLLNPGTGSNWGSRYLVPLLPFFVAAAWAYGGAPRWLAPALAILGLLIALPTFAGFYQRYYHEQGQQAHVQAYTYWRPHKAPMIGVWGSTRREVADAVQTSARDVAATVTPDSRSSPSFFKVVDQWWWMTPTAHIPWPLGFLVATCMFGGGALLFRRSTPSLQPAA